MNCTTSKYTVGLLLLSLALAAAGNAAAQQPAKSQWVFPGADGKLVYKTTPAGDKIMDFSHAGYMGGGVKLPIGVKGITEL